MNINKHYTWKDSNRNHNKSINALKKRLKISFDNSTSLNYLNKTKKGFYDQVKLNYHKSVIDIQENKKRVLSSKEKKKLFNSRVAYISNNRIMYNLLKSESDKYYVPKKYDTTIYFDFSKKKED